MPTETAAEPKLHVWDAFWDHRPAECPCDEDFVAWLDAEGIRDRTIFHFGTGGHHLVGIENARSDRRNAVYGITASPAEHAAFVELATGRPDVLRLYNCLFGDAYLLEKRLLPRFDVATLFHLCEFRTEKNDRYGAMSDGDLLRLLAGQIEPGGFLLFFPGSFAWRREGPSGEDAVADWAAASPGFVRVGFFRSLLVYRRAQ